MLTRRSQQRRVATVVASFLLFFMAGGAAAAETVTLRWATWGPPLVDQQLIEAFEATHPNIRIEYIGSSYGEHHGKLKVLAASGVPVDVFAVDGYYTVEFVAANMLLRIDELMARDGEFKMEDYFPPALLDVQVRGATYGLPYISAPQYMIYNVSHFKEAGLPIPDPHWDRETFAEYARKLTRFEGGQTIRYGTHHYIGWGTFWHWIWSAGGRVVDENHRRFLLTEPEAVDALEFLNTLRRQGISGPGNFAAETASISQTYPAGFPSVSGVEWPFEWDVILWPAGPGGQYSIWKGNVMAINPATEHLEEAWTFLKFLLGPNSPGTEIYVRNKRFPPPTRDVDLWNVFHNPGDDPRSLREITLLLASGHGRPLPHLLQWDAVVVNTIQPALAQIESGQLPPRLAMEQIREAVERLLEDEPVYESP